LSESQWNASQLSNENGSHGLIKCSSIPEKIKASCFEALKILLIHSHVDGGTDWKNKSRHTSIDLVVFLQALHRDRKRGTATGCSKGRCNGLRHISNKLYGVFLREEKENSWQDDESVKENSTGDGEEVESKLFKHSQDVVHFQELREDQEEHTDRRQPNDPSGDLHHNVTQFIPHSQQVSRVSARGANRNTKHNRSHHQTHDVEPVNILFFDFPIFDVRTVVVFEIRLILLQACLHQVRRKDISVRNERKCDTWVIPRGGVTQIFCLNHYFLSNYTMNLQAVKIFLRSFSSILMASTPFGQIIHSKKVI
jgi:hypothetical protein